MPIYVLAVLLFLVGPMSAVARQGLVPLIFAAFLTLSFLPAVRARWRMLVSAPLLLFVAPLLLWTLIANAWSPSLHLVAWLQMALTLAAGVFVGLGFSALDRHATQFIARAAMVGGVALMVFLFEESMTKAAFLSLVRPADVQSSADTFFSLIMSLAARGTAVLSIVVLPTAALIYVFTRSYLWPVIFVLVAFVACARLPMTTSAVGLVGACLAATLVYMRPRVFLTLLLAGMAVMILVAGPAARLIPDQAAVSPAQSQLELGVQHRLGIWRHVGDLIGQQPLLGHGYNAARDFAARQDKIEGLGLPALPTHPHNAPLQIWLELGAIGAVLAVLALFGVWCALRPLYAQPVRAALAASVLAPAAVIAFLSFSVWSTWWLAALGLAAGLCVITIKLFPDASQD